MATGTSPFLAAVMRAVRAGRPMLPEDQPYFTRVEKVPAGNYVEIWFRTGGCTWDHAGGCTMCNYGYSTPVDAAGAVAAVRVAVEALREPADELMISPSGGLWDPGEVPAAALGPIYELAASVRPQRFFVETRAETVSRERVAELRDALPTCGLAVEVGLESAFDPVLTYCVNKGSDAQEFVRAAQVVRDGGALMYANVSLGTAFLGRVTGTHDAVGTVRWSLANGADRVVLFPLHVKPNTLLHFLAEHDRYQQTTLWDLVEALHDLGPQISERVEIAWYKSYYDETQKITRSPSGCARCHHRLVEQLDRYRATQSFEVIADLHASRCDCALPPALDQAPERGDRLAQRLLGEYEFLAKALDMQAAWQRWRPRLEPAIHEAFAGYSPDLAQVHVG